MNARRVVTALALFAVSTALWVPCLQFVFRPPPRDALVDGLARRQRVLTLADTSTERALLRRLNPEWDLMSRTFAALAFTNLALSQPERRAEHLEVADALILQTLRDEIARAPLLSASRTPARAPFHDAQQRSLFVDGELALMLAARQARRAARRLR
jgi:mannose/cellobiose epimerase-like protein (N-acyl-D-glucosamine 2-epimerase family)